MNRVNVSYMKRHTRDTFLGGEPREGFPCPLPVTKGNFRLSKKTGYKNRAMNKQELIKVVAAASGLRVVDVSKAMSAFENILEDCMARGEILAWSGVGILLRAGTQGLSGTQFVYGAEDSDPGL